MTEPHLPSERESNSEISHSPPEALSRYLRINERKELQGN
jgi:hypothetical protein